MPNLLLAFSLKKGDFYWNLYGMLLQLHTDFLLQGAIIKSYNE